MRWGWLILATILLAGCQTLLRSASSPPNRESSRQAILHDPASSVAGQSTATTAPETGHPVQLASAVATPPAAAQVIPATDQQERAAAMEDDADPLTQAAQSLSRGDQSTAARHLQTYVDQHPDQLMFRAQLAELLLRLDRLDEAKSQFEQFVLAAQQTKGATNDHMVHCHTRLMEIAQRNGERFDEVFHRGLGLLLLVQRLERESGRADETREEVLCQAIQALNQARQMRPTDPRTHLSLAEDYLDAGNRRSARVAFATARNLAVPGGLTPAEQDQLGLLPEAIH